MTTDLQVAIGQAFEPVPEVEQVVLAQNGDVLRVFAVIDSDEDDAVYDRLYERERLLKTLHASKMRFSVIVRRGRKAEDLIGNRLAVWQRSSELCHNAMNI